MASRICRTHAVEAVKDGLTDHEVTDIQLNDLGKVSDLRRGLIVEPMSGVHFQTQLRRLARPQAQARKFRLGGRQFARCQPPRTRRRCATR